MKPIRLSRMTMLTFFDSIIVPYFEMIFIWKDF